MFLLYYDYICKVIYSTHYNYIRLYMIQSYARVSVEMPENEEKKSLHQELTYEIENPDINDEFTIKI